MSKSLTRPVSRTDRNRTDYRIAQSYVRKLRSKLRRLREEGVNVIGLELAGLLGAK